MNPLKAIKRSIELHLVAVVPPELDECESCRVPSCTRAQAETCERRKQCARSFSD